MKLCEQWGHENDDDSSACEQCGSSEFWEPPASEAVQASGPRDVPKQSPSDDQLGRLVGSLVISPVLVWLALTFLYFPSQRDASGQPSIAAPTPGASTPLSPELAVVVALATYVPKADPRVELMKGNNLDIYVSRSSFEDVPYPDRSKAISEVGKAWCERVTGFFLPAVRLRDVRSGNVMASYSCVLRRGSVEGP